MRNLSFGRSGFAVFLFGEQADSENENGESEGAGNYTVESTAADGVKQNTAHKAAEDTGNLRYGNKQTVCGCAQMNGSQLVNVVGARTDPQTAAQTVKRSENKHLCKGGYKETEGETLKSHENGSHHNKIRQLDTAAQFGNKEQEGDLHKGTNREDHADFCVIQRKIGH